MKETRPTADERDFFDSKGYLQLDSLLPSTLVEKLLDRLDAALERRAALERSGVSSNRPGKRLAIEGEDRRIFHILDDDPEFLELVDYPPIMPYVHELLHQDAHFHASDAIWEQGAAERGPGWHIDGADRGYRSLRPQIPLLQLKIGYFLSDMTRSDQGNLMIVPGSHRDDSEPDPELLSGFDTLPGGIQVCGPPGTAVLFHNALWHSQGPKRRPGGRRIMLYYAYEVPWVMGNPEHWSYPPGFYNALSPERRKLFHGFLFDPREYRFS